MKRPQYRESTIPQNAKKVFKGVLFDVYQWEQKLFDGSTATFEKLARADTAIVFPVLEDGHILLIRDEQPTKTLDLVAPSGRVEEGEMPEKAALRELVEETGYAPKTLAPFYSHTPASKIDWVVYAFIGKGCRKVAEPSPDPGERITLLPVTFDELIDAVMSEKATYHYGYFGKLVSEAVMYPEKMRALKALFQN